MSDAPLPPLRLGSMCTGYGGLDLAVRQVFGGDLAWVADNDPSAARILAHHHPGVPNLGDITATNWGKAPPVDVVLGGYPCQPFSTAGKRKGTEDDRHLWPHIAAALGVLRPRLAVFENVAGHLSLGFDTVLADLARLGFDACWRTLRASDVGAAHQRNRLFFLAWPADTTGLGCEGQGLPGRAPDGGVAAAHPLDLRGDRDRARGTGRDEPAPCHLLAAHAAGIGEREPADEALTVAGSGNAWSVAGSGSLLTAADTGRRGLQGGPAGDGSAPAQSVADADGPGLQRGPAAHSESDRREQGRSEPARFVGGSDAPLSDAPDWGDYGPAIQRWEHILGRPAPRPVDALGRLSPGFTEWLMGLPAGHVTTVPGLSRTAQLKALGNGIVPRQATTALRHLAQRAIDTAAQQPD